MKLGHNEFINLCKSQPSATVSDLETLTEPDPQVIQFGQQRDDDNQNVGVIHLQPGDENDAPRNHVAAHAPGVFFPACLRYAQRLWAIRKYASQYLTDQLTSLIHFSREPILPVSTLWCQTRPAMERCRHMAHTSPV
jgi:hypothetical protein